MTVSPGADRVLPIGVRLEFVHVLVDRLATAAGCRVLHIKGIPAAVQLGLTGRRPVDVDVWVAPTDADRLIAALTDAGWVLDEPGSSTVLYRHAAVLNHAGWGCSIDVHHRFPGIGLDSGRAFDLAWSGRERLVLGGRSVMVPDRALQALLVLLHAVRGLGTLRAADDVRQVRSNSSPEERLRIAAWADLLACPTAALTLLPRGSGQEEAGSPQHAPTTALSLWLGRLASERSWWLRARLLWAAVLPDRHVMSIRAGRPVAGVGLVRQWLARWRTGFVDVVRLLPTARPEENLEGTPGRDPVGSHPGWPLPRPVPRRPTPEVWSARPVARAAAGVAWTQQDDTTYVADLDASRIHALNSSAALVWHVTRSLPRCSEETLEDLAVARITTGPAGPAPGVAGEVRTAIAELRAAGLLDDVPGS